MAGGFASNLGDLIVGIDEHRAAVDQAEELRKLGIEPEFYGGDYEDSVYSGDFTPQQYDDPIAAQYETISEDPRVRQVQMDALQSLIDRSSGAADAKMQAASFGALDEANQLARSREDAIRMDAQRKGQSGSGMDSVMRAQAAQSAANRARVGTQQAALDAALQKLAATEGAMAGADQMRGRDFQRNSANSNIINDFNRFNTQALNAARQANVNMQNQAGMRNLDARQGMNNSRAGTKNRSIDRRDRLSAASHDAKMDRFSMQNAVGDKARRGLGRAVTGGVGMGQNLMDAATAGMSGGYGRAAQQPSGGMGSMGAAGGSVDNPLDPEKDWVYG
jgi:hypothetical protein